jgi:type IV pilus assembly protein PilM
MATRRAVGLDIGSFAVRAAEVTTSGGAVTLSRFAQVALPPGAVHNGEVVEPDAVSAAIRRLWSEGGFKGRGVIIGVANQRVIVRQAELPAMSEEDMVSALQFEAQELIPIPVEEAILDFQMLETIPGADGENRVRILLAAAQRDMVRSHLAAVEGAGLDASMVDLVPFALIRALDGARADVGDGEAGSEAIIDIGGGVTNVVVHEGGVPRFVRVLLVGGDDITEAIARELDVTIDAAEDLKRRVGDPSPDAAVQQAARIVAERVNPLAEEIRGSLDYYQAQPDAEPIRRILVTGGGARMSGTVERLRQILGDAVELAQPLLGVRIGKTGFSESELDALGPELAVPIGLALAGGTRADGGRRISLLPTENVLLREQRRQMFVAGAAVAALAALLLILWIGRAAQVSSESSKARRAEAQAARTQAQIKSLGDVTSLGTDLSQRQAAISTLLAKDVAWTRLLQEVATVLPNDVWLTQFSGSDSDVNFTAQGLDQASAARWLLRVGDLKSLTNLWVPSSNKQPGPNGQVAFTSTAVLTPAANSDRAQKYSEGTP